MANVFGIPKIQEISGRKGGSTVKFVRMALMTIGSLQIVRFTVNFLREMPSSPQYMQAREYVETTAVKVQSGVNTGAETVQKGIGASVDGAQSGFGALINQLDNNGLFVLFASLIAIFLLRRLIFKQGASSGGGD